MDVPVVVTPNGRTRALEDVTIRARVRGFLTHQPVEAAQTYEGFRVITSGLDSGVPVIVDGQHLIQPGITVKITPAILARRGSDRTTISAADFAGEKTDGARAHLVVPPKT
jgi:hypothetical protein